MAQFSRSTLSKAGLLIAAILAVTPTSLHAEQNQLRKESLPAVIAPIKTTGIQNSVPALSIPTPSKPVTTNSIPTATKQPTTTTATQPPVVDVVNLILKLKERKVYVYQGSKVVAKYPVAIGKKGWETPTGEWQVMEKVTNPGWTNFKNGSVIKPGSQNPLGERWIGFWTDGKDVIGFHGTPSVDSIGKAVSHGCVRMFNKDVKALFPLVKVGTTVKVVNE